jgi:hypothetical protein
MKAAKEFRHMERVKFGGAVHKVVDNKNGWLTIVPESKCNSLTMMIDHSRTVRAKEVLIGVACLSCDWPCDCDEWEVNR